ncbi:MAG: hypothetical protein FWF37_00160 [Chloroflexi bacterium]|nr:hypothetical protein [Chloroflexota bacterium]
MILYCVKCQSGYIKDEQDVKILALPKASVYADIEEARKLLKRCADLPMVSLVEITIYERELIDT